MKKIAADRNYRLFKKGDDLSVGGPAVYVVSLNMEYEGGTIQAIFSSEAKAQAAIDAADPIQEWDMYTLDIDSYQLDKIPDDSWKLAPADELDDDEDEDLIY